MRKYATGQSSASADFPAPVVLGEPSHWHLVEIVASPRMNTTSEAPDHVLEVSQAAARLNFESPRARLKKIPALSLAVPR